MYDRLSPEEEALSARSLPELGDAELERWMWACRRMERASNTSWIGRWIWRRRVRRAQDAISARTRARLGPGPALCERCRSRRPTVHVVYGKGAEEHYGHFCAGCSKLEPPGRLAVFEAGP